MASSKNRKYQIKNKLPLLITGAVLGVILILLLISTFGSSLKTATFVPTTSPHVSTTPVASPTNGPTPSVSPITKCTLGAVAIAAIQNKIDDINKQLNILQQNIVSVNEDLAQVSTHLSNLNTLASAFKNVNNANDIKLKNNIHQEILATLEEESKLLDENNAYAEKMQILGDKFNSLSQLLDGCK